MRKNSTFAALLALAMPISSLNASMAQAATNPDYLPVIRDYQQKQLPALTKAFETFKASAMKSGDRKIFKNNLDAVTKFIKDNINNYKKSDLKGFLQHCDKEIRENLVTELGKMLSTCQGLLDQQDPQSPNTSKLDNLTNLKQNIEDSITAANRLFEHEDVKPAAAVAPLQLDPAQKLDFEHAAPRINQARPGNNPAAVQPAAPASQSSFMTKTKWAVALAGLAIVGGLTVGQTKYKMFTRLFDKMTTKAIVKLSWWGWFKHLIRLA